MVSEVPYLSLKGIDDELQGLRLHAFNTLLHHVVAVLVLDTLQDMAVQLPNHLILLRGERTSRKHHQHSWLIKVKFSVLNVVKDMKGLKDAPITSQWKSSTGQAPRWSLLCYRNH